MVHVHTHGKLGNVVGKLHGIPYTLGISFGNTVVVLFVHHFGNPLVLNHIDGYGIGRRNPNRVSFADTDTHRESFRHAHIEPITQSFRNGYNLSIAESIRNSYGHYGTDYSDTQSFVEPQPVSHCHTDSIPESYRKCFADHKCHTVSQSVGKPHADHGSVHLERIGKCYSDT